MKPGVVGADDGLPAKHRPADKTKWGLRDPGETIILGQLLANMMIVVLMTTKMMMVVVLMTTKMMMMVVMVLIPIRSTLLARSSRLEESRETQWMQQKQRWNRTQRGWRRWRKKVVSERGRKEKRKINMRSREKMEGHK